MHRFRHVYQQSMGFGRHLLATCIIASSTSKKKKMFQNKLCISKFTPPEPFGDLSPSKDQFKWIEREGRKGLS